MKNKKSFFLGILIVLLIEVIFFRSYLCTDVLFGDEGDGLLNNLIVEHWYQTFRGMENFRNLNIFYPITNTISYTDMLLGLALPYGFLRMLGVNMFLANKLMLIVMHMFGALTFFYLLNRRVRLSIAASIIGCILMFSASNFYAKVGHTQLFTMGYVPLLFLLMSYYYENYQLASKQRYVYGILSVLMLAFILYTSWYVGFFVCFFSLIIALNLTYIYIKSNGIGYCLKTWRKNAKEGTFYVGIFVVALIPFMVAYLSTAKLTGQWDWNSVKMMLPAIYDFVNVSGANLFYGNIFIKNFFVSRPLSWELCLGYPFFTLLLFIVACCHYIKNYNNKQKNFLVVISIGTLISFVLLVKVFGVSLWYFVFKLIPGASALRAASRYMFFLSFAVSIIVASFYDYMIERHEVNQHKLLYIGISMITACFLLLENMHNTAHVNNPDNRWTISKQQAFINKVASPNNNLPFYIANEHQEKFGEPNYEYQLQSWLIANKHNLKTVNGYSGKFPPGWDLFNVTDKQYQNHVDEWMLRNNIQVVQKYDIAENRWSEHKPQKNTVLYLDGWYGQENWGRWTSENIATVIVANDAPEAKLEMAFLARAFNTNKNVAIIVNNQKITEIDVTPKDKNYVVMLPTDIYEKSSNLKITFVDNNKRLSPKEVNGSKDTRKLGIGIGKIIIRKIE